LIHSTNTSRYEPTRFPSSNGARHGADDGRLRRIQSFHSFASLGDALRRQIDDFDRSGPAINSIIELNPDALAIARELDKERKEKGPRSPLHGIPVLIKDNVGTHNRMMTTAGSFALLGSIPPRDSFVAQKLREAGALILGKTNLSEWANFRSSRSTSGWSGRAIEESLRTGSQSLGSAPARGGGRGNLCAWPRHETDSSITSPVLSTGRLE
jgi:amidase